MELENKEASVVHTTVWLAITFLKSVNRGRGTRILVQMFERSNEWGTYLPQ